MRRGLISGLFALAAAPATGAAAQALTPMVTSVNSFNDRYLVRLDVLNPYADSRYFQMTAYTPEGAPVAIWTDSESFQLSAHGVRRVNVTAPFEGAQEREIYVCVETQVENDTNMVRGQVCSRVRARRLQAPSS